ncbi:MAG: hypothetical protein UW20_C0005G0051 [Candidatus Woesebacteria bacterium GW2011_GWB1_44_11]|uniref:Uncharacterized protein n=2 Tax=Candidatus Woeseibacteriota TaxID=1752722 RepID=A0A1F8DJX0_9BACT|nr:MAG: hypothetical protein UW20_C0005G0051 [Candidatus Woesebacteria bacterium GW2011_GWB1_44_11]OGM88075.1 MAG: hypothetical protein A2573_01045 [Candidatus Woesebacteria bacterium RIFOXYD1_FULL_43_18]
MDVLDHNGVVLHSWTLSDPSDIIGATVGGNRYGWFAYNQFSFLAIDNSQLIIATEPQKVDFCHKEGKKGTFHLINVSVNAEQAHINHGDGLPGEEVPGTEDAKRFTEDCSIIDQLILVEIVEVPADKDTDTTSSDPLESGVNYVLKARGTADAGDGIEFDARYSIRTLSSSDWTDAVSTYGGYGVTLLDLLYNGSTPWGEFNASHDYETTVTGAGVVATFRIYDVYYPNNTGDLYVDIYQKLW